MASAALANDFGTLQASRNFQASTSSRTSPILEFGKFHHAYSQPLDQKWQVEVVSKVVEFLNLPAGWDGYNAPAVRHDTGMFAIQVLAAVMRPRTPLPQIVPSSVGGIQFEWHERGIDLELHISAPLECEIWFEDLTGAIPPISETLTSDLSKATEAVRILTAR
jgi:hypothetical protein